MTQTMSKSRDKIPAKYVKMDANILDEPLTQIFNTSIDKNKFCESPKITVPPVHNSTCNHETN